MVLSERAQSEFPLRSQIRQLSAQYNQLSHAYSTRSTFLSIMWAFMWKYVSTETLMCVWCERVNIVCVLWVWGVCCMNVFVCCVYIVCCMAVLCDYFSCVMCVGECCVWVYILCVCCVCRVCVVNVLCVVKVSCVVNVFCVVPVCVVGVPSAWHVF